MNKDKNWGLGVPWGKKEAEQPALPEWQAPHFDEDGNAIAGDIVDSVNTPEVQRSTDAEAAERLRAQLKKNK